MHRIALVAVAAAAAGCGSKEDARARACEPRVAELEAALQLVIDGDSVAPHLATDVTLPRSTAGAPLRAWGTTIELTAAGDVWVDGRPLADVGRPLHEHLELRREADRHLGAGRPPGPVHVAADARAPVARLREVLAAVPAAHRERHLLVREPAARLPPPERLLAQGNVRTFRAQVDAADPSERAVLVARAVEQAVGGCAPLIELFGSVAAVEDKARHLAKGTPAALRACRCRVADLDLLAYALTSLFGLYEPRVLALPLDGLDRAAAALPAAATAGDLAAALAAAPPAP